MFHSRNRRRLASVGIALVVSVFSLVACVAQVVADDASWLILLYFDADDEMLEQSIWADLNEAEWVGSTDEVTIVAQLDRYDGGFEGDGGWSTTRRYRITRDDDFFALGSPVLMELGEVNMGRGQTLVDFATWAIATYPADRVGLILSDHGAGWPGGWYDHEPPPADNLALSELDGALQEIRDQTGLARFDLIGFDACLMSHLEVASAVAPHARVMVASQEVEPGIGWAYAAFLDDLTNRPQMTAAELAGSIVASYLEGDRTIVDPRVRTLFFMEQFYEMTDEARSVVRQANASQLAQIIEDVGVASEADMLESLGIAASTLAAIDLTRLDSVHAALDGFVSVIQEIDQAAIAEARAYAQSFESVFGEDVPPSYIDLGHFVRLVQAEAGDSAIANVATALLDAIDRAVVAERHGNARMGASGLSIYFPNAALFGGDQSGLAAYRGTADRFALRSTWDDYLSYHFIGGEISAPGQGEITILPLSTTDTVLAPGEIAVIDTEITGDNIGFVYLFVGLHFPEDNSFLIVDRDFVEEESKLVGGVYLPDWPKDEAITLSFVWKAELWSIDDEQTSEFVLIPPESFGASPELATYGVEGVYLFAESGETRDAMAIFQDGELQRVIGFASEDGVGAPRQIQIRPGDMFTALHHWLNIVDETTAEVEYSTSEGPTFTFGGEPLTWDTFPAFTGDYLVGFQVEDLEGSVTEEYVWYTVSDDPALLWTEGTLFRDNFVPGESDWLVEDWGTGAAYYIEDLQRYGLWVGDAGSYSLAWSPHADTYPGSFVVEVDAALDSGPEDGEYGIVWGPDSETFYALQVSADGWCKLEWLLDGEWQPRVLDWTECPEALVGYQANQLRVVVNGDEITLVVNEGVVATIASPNLGPGQIGVIAETYETPDVWTWFDNFQVWTLEGG